MSLSLVTVPNKVNRLALTIVVSSMHVWAIALSSLPSGLIAPWAYLHSGRRSSDWHICFIAAVGSSLDRSAHCKPIGVTAQPEVLNYDG